MDSGIQQLESQFDTLLTVSDSIMQPTADEQHEKDATWCSPLSSSEGDIATSLDGLLVGYTMQKVLRHDGTMFWDTKLRRDPHWRSDNPRNCKIVTQKEYELSGSAITWPGYNEIDLEWPQANAKPPHAATFTAFPRLPTELRLQTWTNALPDPWVVSLSTGYVIDGESGTFDILQQFPRGVLCCREFWAVFNDDYHRFNIKGSTTRILRNCFFDYQRDTLRISIHCLQNADLDREWLDVAKVEHLAIPYEDERLGDGSSTSIWERVEGLCPKLKTFELVLINRMSLHWPPRTNDVGRFITVDTRFRDLQPCEHGSRLPQLLELGSSLLDRAHTLQTAFEGDPARNHRRWQSIRFNVVVSAVDITCCAPYYAQRIYFELAQPLIEGQYFFTDRPTKIEANGICVQLRDVNVPGIAASPTIACGLDGEFSSPYDGVTKFFEDGGFQERDEDKEWTKFGGGKLRKKLDERYL